MGKGTQTTQQTTAASPQATAAYSQLLGQAQNVAATPYQAYTGELTAPVNSQQQQGIGGINAAAGQAQPAINQALGIAGQAANPLTQQQIQNYQNPYTQDVVNATQAQFNNQNQQGQEALTGNNIAAGALGGNRSGIAAANLANQQQLAQAPTIAGLYSNSYNQGLATAAQQYQQNPLAAAGSIANFGVSGQNAALSGAGAQLGAGTLEQQTQQAADTANYGQYAQAQAYPFQTEQWLAGLEGAVAPGLGATSTTVGPPPNTTAQYLGAGVAGGALLLSDRRAKRNVHKVGSLNDGQPIYRYQYHNSDEWHIGPIAQEVEKHQPHAVHEGIGGAKYVDLKAATDASISKASGGGIGGSPWSFAQGWVPTFSGSGSTAPHASGPSNPTAASPNINWGQLGNTSANPNGIFGANGTLGSASFGGGNALSGDSWGGSASQPLPGLDASDYAMARGGGVGRARFADGGSPSFDERFVGGDDPTFEDRFAPANDSPFLPMTPSQGIDTRMQGPPTPEVYDDGQGPVRLYGDRPVGDETSLQGTGIAANPSGKPSVVAQDDEEEDGAAPGNAPVGPSAGVAPPAGTYSDTINSAPYQNPGLGAPSKGLGIGLGVLSPNAQTGLLAAGLGMLASRSPFLGNAIGEGGAAGLSAYNAGEEHDRKIADEAAKLSHEAKKEADELALKKSSQAETARHNKATEAKEFKPQLVHTPNPATGREEYATYDPNTKKMSPVEFPSIGETKDNGKFVSQAAPKEERRKAPPASPEARDEGYAKWLEDHRPPGYADIVRGVADYEIDPNREASLQKGQRDQLYRDVKQYDPTYDQTHFGEKVGVINSFSRGADRAAVNSLNVSVSHLGTLKDLGAALQNGNIPLVNRIINQAGIQTGGAAVTNFNAAKEIVGDEVVKAIVGGVSAQADRDAIKHLIMAQQSPAQLQGTINTFISLLGGQLEGRRTGYQAGTGLNNFDQKYLSPETREALTRVKVTGGTIDPAITKMVYPSGVPAPNVQTQHSGASSAFTPPSNALARQYNGKTYYYDPQTKQPYPGQQ